MVTTKNEDRCYKECQCGVCGSVSTCTPHNDFYSTEVHGDKILCTSCFNDHVRNVLRSKPGGDDANG